jgi:uracil phosphoribosyltransferase
MLIILGKESSVLNQFIAEIRDTSVQQDRMRFRRNVERIGEIFAYEISRKLNYTTREVTTPLGFAAVPMLSDQLVAATILRAGLPLHQGILNIFDKADNAFISAYRKHRKDGTFDISLEYISSPSLKDKVLLLSDTMLATGSSMVLAYRALIRKEKPAHTHIVSVIASMQGIKYVRQHLPSDVTLWVGAVDDELTAQSYIVPGLGDAGDLSYGIKE